MKKQLLILMGTILPAVLSAQYCIPPPFLTGPFTGITNVKIGTLDHNSGDSDGVTYYESVAAPKLEKGQTYTMSVTTQHNLIGTFSGNLYTHAWIDFNQNGDFLDDGETIFKQDDKFKGTYTQEVTIPADAKPGITRMRVYEDMPAYEGHEYPHPCGYAHYPNNFLGHHGESEDYNVEIVGAATGIAEILVAQDFTAYTNISGRLEIKYQLSERADVTVTVYNALGQKLLETLTFTQAPGLQTVTLKELSASGNPFLIVHLRTNDQVQSRKLINY